MSLNLFNMIIQKANLVSTTARSFILEVIEHGKAYGMVHDKILYDQGIIQDLGNPTALCISYNICLRVFSRTNILKCKINSVYYTRSPKDVRILALHNRTSGLTAEALSVMIWMTF